LTTDLANASNQVLFKEKLEMPEISTYLMRVLKSHAFLGSINADSNKVSFHVKILRIRILMDGVNQCDEIGFSEVKEYLV